MDIKELVKLQFVTQMGSAAAGHGHAGHSGSNKSFFQNIILMMLMSLLDDITKFIPKVFSQIKQYILTYCTDKVQETIDKPKALTETSVTLSTKHFISSLKLDRTYIKESSSSSSSSSKPSDASEESQQMVDAVLAQIAKLHNVPSFKLIDKGQVMVTYKEKPIQLTKEIFFKIDDVTYSPEGAVSSVKFTLLSNTLSASEITQYVKNVYDIYLQEIKNALGNNIYFFDQKSKDSSPPPVPTGVADATAIANHKRMLISTAPKQLNFTMSPFYSNKKFSNIYGDVVRMVEHRVKFFVENKEWYDAKGIPYQLGILLSGVPGSGKTSLIKALANYTKRHIINVNFANINTATQLKNLFTSDKLVVYTDNTMSTTNTYFIPIEQRIYVLEEIDAIGDIVKQRAPEQPGDSTNKNQAINDELTLAEILTILDGTMEIPGRIVIMTTNHPEVLDKALIRPGRIDVNAHFDNAKRELIAEMFEGYFDKPFPQDRINELPDSLLSPAEAGQVLFRHFADLDINRLIEDLNQTAKPKQAHSACNSQLHTPSSPRSVSAASEQEKEQAQEQVPEKETMSMDVIALEQNYGRYNHDGTVNKTYINNLPMFSSNTISGMPTAHASSKPSIKITHIKKSEDSNIIFKPDAPLFNPNIELRGPPPKPQEFNVDNYMCYDKSDINTRIMFQTSVTDGIAAMNPMDNHPYSCFEPEAVAVA